MSSKIKNCAVALKCHVLDIFRPFGPCGEPAVSGVCHLSLATYVEQRVTETSAKKLFNNNPDVNYLPVNGTRRHICFESMTIRERA